jgi:hypothetical protein
MNPTQLPALVTELRRLARAQDQLRNARTIHRLQHRLERANAQRLPAVVAEVLVARRAMLSGCRVEAETPTPTGRTCDFLLERAGERLYVHVKTLQAGAFEPPRIPKALGQAVRSDRPIRVSARWSPHLSPAALRRAGESLDAFVQGAAIGESITVRNGRQEELAHFRVDRPAECFELVAERPDRVAVLERLDRLLDRACQQSMPGQPNAIMVVGRSEADADLMDQALLGAFVARWDRHPPRGQRQAFGRDDTGLWSRQASRHVGVACWTTLQDGSARPRLSGGHMWLRGHSPPRAQSAALARAALLRARAS